MEQYFDQKVHRNICFGGSVLVYGSNCIVTNLSSNIIQKLHNLIMGNAILMETYNISHKLWTRSFSICCGSICCLICLIWNSITTTGHLPDQHISDVREVYHMWRALSHGGAKNATGTCSWLHRNFEFTSSVSLVIIASLKYIILYRVLSSQNRSLIHGQGYGVPIVTNSGQICQVVKQPAYIRYIRQVQYFCY